MRQRRSRDEIQQIVEQFRTSGLSKIEYCRQNGVVLSSLGRYLRRHESSGQRFVRVKVEPPAAPDTGFVLMLVNGRRIASSWGFADADLARLIRVAESA
jgi:transposase-like protein